MSDAARLFQTVARIVNQFLPALAEEHRVTLSYLMTGLLKGQQVHLKEIADAVKYPHKKMSLVDRFRRFLRNDQIVVNSHYLPFIELILSALSREELVLMIDVTPLGGNCQCLMVSVRYKSRALPLAWVIVKGKKGHTAVAIQLALLEQVKRLLPDSAPVVLLGDGEFDASELINWLQQQPTWRYVCRTATKLLVQVEGQWQPLAEHCPEPEQERFLRHVWFTKTDAVGPLNILIVWNAQKQAHWCFVTNCATQAEAQGWYEKRFTIETFFADLKSRGFHLHRTRLFKPDRLSRLLLAVALAYLFLVFLGVELIVAGPLAQLVRSDRFEHSLFRLGRIYLNHLLNEGLLIPLLQRLRPPSSFAHVVL